MLKAKDIMSKDVVTLAPDTEIILAAKLLLEKGFNGVPVVDADKKLIGILCQSDLVAQQKKLKLPSVFSILDGFLPFDSLRDFDREMERIAALNVEGAMSRNPISVSADTSIEDVATLMVDKGYHTLPVVEDAKLVGIIGMRDILSTLIGAGSTPNAS
ncbi:CBS domain-containing protein [Desulfovibrio inopinatus]|uniref:CBS domain-containing protein n=1 Tax=Desulfovibrio inopinatus TaxID=102109 RepID=UPI0004223DD0|nr:CBS domain-containing protein [Desulfovibrio inopinatus]